jgi:hypothetical protein
VYHRFFQNKGNDDESASIVGVFSSQIKTLDDWKEKKREMPSVDDEEKESH